MKTLLKRFWVSCLVAACLAAPSVRAEIAEWLPLDPDMPMNANPAKNMGHPNLVTMPSLVGADKLYAAWVENGGPSNALQVRVAVYQDATPAWKQIDSRVNNISRSPGLGINFDTTATAYTPRLVVHGGDLYATWYEYVQAKGGRLIGKIRVCRYNGTDENPNWTFVDGNTSGGLNFNSTQDAIMPNAVSFGGRLVVFWSEAVSSTRTVSGTQLRARAYTIGTGWTWLDGGTAAGLNIDPKLGAYSGCPVVVNVQGQPSKLYVSFRQLSSTGVAQLRVKVYQGGYLWKVVDGGLGLNLDLTKGAAGQNAGGDGNAIYCAWTEYNAAGVRQLRMARYNGFNDNAPVWERLDSGYPMQGLNYNPAVDVYSVGVQSFNGKIYLHWNEGTLRVAVWDKNLTAPNQWGWADGGAARSNAHRYENSTTNLACLGVYRDHLLVFHNESVPSSLDPRYPTVGLGHVLVGIEAPTP